MHSMTGRMRAAQAGCWLHSYLRLSYLAHLALSQMIVGEELIGQS